MILVFLGPPGSGKGTQAKKFLDQKGIPQLSTGDMFRAAISNGTPLGIKAKSFMDRGELVPDQVVIDMLLERIAKDDCKSGFILDGFPRTIPQAEALDRELGGKKLKIDQAILFQIEDKELVGRLSGRRTCPKCNSMYHVDSAKPKTAGICDKCGNALLQRDDDKVEVIEKRLNVYHQQTKPLVGYYSTKGILKSIDATQSPELVFSKISAVI